MFWVSFPSNVLPKPLSPNTLYLITPHIFSFYAWSDAVLEPAFHYCGNKTNLCPTKGAAWAMWTLCVRLCFSAPLTRHLYLRFVVQLKPDLLSNSIFVFIQGIQLFLPYEHSDLYLLITTTTVWCIMKLFTRGGGGGGGGRGANEVSGNSERYFKCGGEWRVS